MEDPLSITLMSCGSKDGPCDSADTGCTTDDAGAEGEDEGQPGTDSCTLPPICFEMNEADNEEWCDYLADTVGAPTTYASTPCPDGAVLVCDLPVMGDTTAPGTSYYYDMTVDEASGICRGAGGTPQ